MAEDLFPEYNQKFAGALKGLISPEKEKVVVVGPPRSGKTFFIKNYLSGFEVEEETLGVIEEKELEELKNAKRAFEELVETFKKLVKELPGRVLGFLRQGSNDLASSGLIDVGDATGVKLPEGHVNRLRELKAHGKKIVFYHIPSSEARDLAEVFKEEKVSFVWYGKEYVPPGLLKFRDNPDKLREQLERYKKLHKLFGIDLEKDILAANIAVNMAEALREKAPEVVAFFVGRFLRLLDPLSLLVEIFIAALLLKKSSGELFEALFEAVDNWSNLDDELKWLAAANLSLVFGLPVKVVYDGMQRLTGEDVRKELKKLKDTVSLISIGPGTIVFPRVKGEDLIGLGVYDGKIYQGNEVYNLVTVKFEELAKAIEKSIIESRGKSPERRLFFVKGLKGIGKSTLVHYVIADLLQRNEFTYAVRVTSPSINPWAFSVDKEDKVILFYDYYPYEAYTSESPSQIQVSSEDVANIIENLSKIVKNNENAYAIVVLSKDVLENPRVNRVIERFPEEQVIEVNLRFEDFIEEMVKSYSGCSNVTEVARAITHNYKGGYTLIAKYVGLWLRGNKCRYEDVKKVLEESKGEHLSFLKKHVSSILRQTTVNWYALPLLVHVFLGEVPLKVAKELPLWLNGNSPDGDYEKYASFVAPWIATRKEDIVEEVIKEHLKDIILRDDSKEFLELYLVNNRKLKEIIENTHEGLKDFFAELENRGVKGNDLDAVKAFIGYDKKLWDKAAQNFYVVLEGWASGGDKASVDYEALIKTLLHAVIREFIRDKLLMSGQEIDEHSLKFLLKLAARTALQFTAASLFDEANDKLREYLFTEGHEVPVSIRFGIHGFPLFVNGIFNGYKSGEKHVILVNSSWCKYLKQADSEVAKGAALYLLSIPEELPAICKEKIIEIIRVFPRLNEHSIHLISLAFLRFLVRNISLSDKSAFDLSMMLTNIPRIRTSRDILRILLLSGYKLKDKIKDYAIKTIYTIRIIRGLIRLGVDDESIIEEAEGIMSWNDDLLLRDQAALGGSLILFYLSHGYIDKAEKLKDKLEKMLKHIDEVDWDRIADWFKKKGIKVDKNDLKEEARRLVSSALADYYHEDLDINKEKEYREAEYDALVNLLEGEEKAKRFAADEYFPTLLQLDVINAVWGMDLRETLEAVYAHSEEAFNYPSIGKGAVQRIIRQYLIASAYLGRLEEAWERINSNHTLRDSFETMDDEVLLGLYSLISYLSGSMLVNKIREKAIITVVISLQEMKKDIKDFISGNIRLDRIIEEPICYRSVIEVRRILLRELGLDEVGASILIRRFLITKSGDITILSLSALFSGLRGARELAGCLRELRSGIVAELLSKMSRASSEEEFKDALVRLAMYHSY